MHPIITPDDVESHVRGLLLALADRSPGWHGLHEFELDGVYDPGYRRYVGQVARAAAERGFADVRRAATGVQARITPEGQAVVASSPAPAPPR